MQCCGYLKLLLAHSEAQKFLTALIHPGTNYLLDEGKKIQPNISFSILTDSMQQPLLLFTLWDRQRGQAVQQQKSRTQRGWMACGLAE